MKSLLIQYFIFFVFVLCNNIAYSQKTTSSIHSEFSNKIKSLKLKTRSEYFKDMRSIDPNENGYLSNKENYSKEGYLVSSTWYNSDGSIRRIQSFTYDIQGNKITETWASSADSLQTHTLHFDYDENNQMIHARQYLGSDKLLFIFVQEYNPNGEIDTKYTFMRDSTLFTKTIYERESKKLTTTDYSPKGRVRQKTQDDFDDNNDLIRTIVYDAFGDIELKEFYKYTYNDKQLLTEVKVYDDRSRLVGVNTIEYDYY